MLVPTSKVGGSDAVIVAPQTTAGRDGAQRARDAGWMLPDAELSRDANDPLALQLGIGRAGGLSLLSTRSVSKGLAPRTALPKQVLSDYTQSLMHRPIRDWIFGPSEKRSGGLAAQQFGAVPQDPASRQADARELNRHIQIAVGIGKRRGLLPPNYVYPHTITENDFGRVISEFDLAASPGDNTWAVKALLHPEHLEHRECPMPTVKDIMSSNGGNVPEQSKCASLERAQKSRRIQLRWSNLRTLLHAVRWLDSVVIDAAIHAQLEAWPMRHLAFVNSAETDVSLAELKQTPSCYKLIVLPLFWKSHWSILKLSIDRRRIVYTNSQLLDKATAELQTRPFRELFPDFELHTETPAQQTDNSSCGVFTAFWSHCFMYWGRPEIDGVTQQQIYRYRERLLHQLILNYAILGHTHA